MTVEKVCFVTPEDIISVRFQCGNKDCGASVIVPISRLINGDIGLLITGACQRCRTASGFNIGMKDLENFLAFNELLAKLKDTMQGKNLKFSLQIECPEYPK